MNKSLEKLAALLPEGLNEQTVDAIVNLVHNILTEEVKAQSKDLQVKVKAFLRGQIESLKEQAIKELELENEVFRNAQLFEAAKSLFVTELNDSDTDNALNQVYSEKDELNEKLDVLAGELDKVLQENVKMRKVLKVVSDKNTQLTESINAQRKSLVESRAAEAMRLSDTAEVVSKENFQRQGKKLNEQRVAARPSDGGNQFLTDDVISLMND